jgi:hypothetical protein
MDRQKVIPSYLAEKIEKTRNYHLPSAALCGMKTHVITAA